MLAVHVIHMCFYYAYVPVLEFLCIVNFSQCYAFSTYVFVSDGTKRIIQDVCRKRTSFLPHRNDKEPFTNSAQIKIQKQTNQIS